MILDKILKITIIVCVFIASASVLYYYAVFLPHKEQAWLEQQSREQREDRLRKQREREITDALLAQCLRKAEIIYGKSLHIINEGIEQCKNKPIFQQGGCGEAFNELLDDAERQQQDKDNCFKQYPQR